MTLTVDIYATDTSGPKVRVFKDVELRWTTGGKIEIVFGGRRAEFLARTPILLLRDKIWPEEEPERFMRNLHRAYPNGYAFVGAAVESETHERTGDFKEP